MPPRPDKQPPTAVTNAVERFSGFAAVYDEFRPPPPDDLSNVLESFHQVRTPELVVDLGCGPGVSTRYWAGKARQVIGIDPSQDMLDQASRVTPAENITYRLGFGHATGLPEACAEIVTCSQSFHWMEPVSTLAEVARILKPGGVLAVYDKEAFPVMPDWRAEQAYREFFTHIKELDRRLGVTDRVSQFPKGEHGERLRQSGHFRFVREVDLHQVVMGNAHQLSGGAEAYGLVQSLRKAGVSDEEMGLVALRKAAQELLGDELKPWYWSTHLVVGVK